MARGTAVSISTSGLRKEFGKITALDGIDVDIEGPQIVGLVGPNGAGKTTMIRCLLGLTGKTGGDSRINGTPSGDLDRADRADLGYMPQEEAVYRNLTVRENVEFFANLYRVPEREAAVNEALAFVGLRDRERSRIGELSGGMVRRTSLACTLVGDPDVVFLDEPTVGLDPKLRSEMWDRFRDRRDDGSLLVVSTHYLGEAHNCDRVLFLRDGDVLAFEDPDALLERDGVEDLEDAFLALLEEDDAAGQADAATTAGGTEA